jgi:hypothetical protein
MCRCVHIQLRWQGAARLKVLAQAPSKAWQGRIASLHTWCPGQPRDCLANERLWGKSAGALKSSGAPNNAHNSERAAPGSCARARRCSAVPYTVERNVG